jgi:hypothetical protein
MMTMPNANCHTSHQMLVLPVYIENHLAADMQRCNNTLVPWLKYNCQSATRCRSSCGLLHCMMSACRTCTNSHSWTT